MNGPGGRRHPDPAVRGRKHRRRPAWKSWTGNRDGTPGSDPHPSAIGCCPYRTIRRGGERKNRLGDFRMTLPEPAGVERPEGARGVGHPDRSVGRFSQCPDAASCWEKAPTLTVKEVHAGRRAGINASLSARNQRGDDASQRSGRNGRHGGDGPAVETGYAVERTEPQHSVGILSHGDDGRLWQPSPIRLPERSKRPSRGPLIRGRPTGG